MTNHFQGLARGPIDHEASSVINVIANGAIEMGATVDLDTTIPASDILPRVAGSASAALAYGIAVGGDNDGVYGDGAAAPPADNSTMATTEAGQGVVIVTQGRCPAKIAGAVTVGATLASDGAGRLVAAAANIIAIALQDGAADDIIAVDVQRERT